MFDYFIFCCWFYFIVRFGFDKLFSLLPFFISDEFIDSYDLLFIFFYLG